MRHIVIDFPLRLISHKPGTLFPVPGTPFHVQCFPTKVIFSRVDTHGEHPFSIPLKGPVKNFTVELNLDESYLKITGHYQEGPAVFIIKKEDHQIHLFQKKGPLSSYHHHISCAPCFNKGSEKLAQLYLGIDKKSDTEKMRLRKDPKEYLPYLYRLASLYPMPIDPTIELHPLLKRWDVLEDKREWLSASENLFLALFTEGFAPRLEDDEFQGIVDSFEGNPLNLWPSLYQRLRQLFISYENDCLSLLPHLLPSFEIGRITGESFSSFTVSFLWKGGEVKRCIIYAKQPLSLALDAPHSKKFRYRGKTFSIGEKISLEKGLHFFDRFTK